MRMTFPLFCMAVFVLVNSPSLAQRGKTNEKNAEVKQVDNRSKPAILVQGKKQYASYEEEERASEKYEYAHAHSSWYYEMLKKRPNINRAEAAFNQYFKNHPTEDSKLKSRFESWVSQASLYKDKNGFGLPFPASKRTQKNGYNAPSVNGSFGTWTMIGPANMDRVQPCNNSNLVQGGFCDRVFVNPYNTQNLFAGFSYGGLWVSTNQGATWQLTDGGFANGTNTYANRDYYYGEIEAHAQNSSLVFAATEAGLLKSANSGINWSISPQLNRNASSSERPYYISLATDDQNIVLCTFGRKVYRSADGGSTWTMVFDNSAGGANHRFTNQYTLNTPFGLNERNFNFFGLEANYNSANEFYLGVWNSSNQACIYKSTDKGLSFSLLVNLNTALSTTWNANTSLCLKTIPSSATKFFVYEQFKNPSVYYKFSSGGALLSSNAINAQPEAFDIDWNNENTVYQGEYSPSTIQKSTNSGVTFSVPYSTASGNCNYLHPDQRGISAVGNVVLIGNDGGLGLSTDGAASINGTGFEINSMDMWGFSSSPKSDICLTGLDHNQTFVRSFAGNGGWKNIKGADAGVCTVNPYDDHWLYYDWAYGVNKGYLNTSTGTVSEYPVSTLPDLGSLQFHPFTLYNIFGIQKNNNNILLQSADNMSSATVFKDFGVKINALRIARTDPKTMYVLLNNLDIQKSTDSGSTWTSVKPSSTASNGETNITAIEVGKTPGELWAAYGNGQNSCKVLYSTDGGSTWTNITTSNLPAVAVSDIAYQRGTNGGVYILTITNNSTLVWYKNNTMPQWQQVGSALPLMGYLKSRLFVVPAKNKIRFGSSRGAWENDLYESSGVQAGLAADKTSTDCSIDSVQFFNNSAYGPGGVSFQWQFPGGSPATSTLENPKVSYTVPGVYGATLTVTTAAGSDAITVNNLITVLSSQCSGIDTVAGKSLSLPATSDAATIASVPLNTNVLTVTAWVKPSGIQSDFTGIITHSSRTGLFVKNGTNELGYMWGDNQWGWNSGLTLPTDQWSHIAWVITPTNTTLYVNGIASVNNVTNNIINLSTSSWSVGEDIGYGSNRNFNGEIDELCIYNRSLTQNEVREKMHLTRPAGENGLIGYYQFNESSSTTFYNRVNGASSMTNAGGVQVTSTAPVASGSAVRISISGAGTYDFGTADAVLSFTRNSGGGNNSKYPGGDVIVYKLNTKPSGLPSASLNYCNRYWIIRNFGTNDTINTLQTLTYRQTGFSGSGNRLFKRNANDFGLTWGNAISNSTTSSSSSNGGTQVFDGLKSIITGFGQFTTGSTSMPSFRMGNAVTGVVTADKKQQLTVSPNPAKGRIEVSYEAGNDNTEKEFEIEDMVGRNVLNRKMPGGSFTEAVDISRLAPGTYVLRVGKLTLKFIKR